MKKKNVALYSIADSVWHATQSKMVVWLLCKHVAVKLPQGFFSWICNKTMKDDSGLEMHNNCGNFDEWKNRTEQTSLIFDYLLLN